MRGYEGRDEAKDVARLFQRGALPVVSVSTAARHPRDEGGREVPVGSAQHDRGEASASRKRAGTEFEEGVEHRHGGQTSAALERS